MLKTLIIFAQRLPPWLRPAYFGAVALFLIVGLRTLFAVPLIIRQHKLGEFALVLAAATGAGAAGGFGYTFLGAPARRIPYVGPYVAGLVTIGAYMLALLVAAPFISKDEPLVSDKSDAIVFACVTAFFGLLAGYFWFRKLD